MTQIASDPAGAVQNGIYELLSGDVDLAALASVYDGPPEDAEPAYVVIGAMISTPDGAHNSHGRQTVATLDTWTRAQGFKPGNDIGHRLGELLTHRHAALDALVEGHTVWRVEHEFSQTLTDPEPGIRHRVDRYRIWTTQEA